MIDRNEGPVWAVCRRDRSHRVRFPARENAERWRANRDDVWDIEPVAADDPTRCGDEYRRSKPDRD